MGILALVKEEQQTLFDNYPQREGVDGPTCLLAKPQGMQMMPENSKIQATQAISTSDLN